MSGADAEWASGCLESVDPETGEADLMGVWLPEGVSAVDIGLARVVVPEVVPEVVP